MDRKSAENRLNKESRVKFIHHYCLDKLLGLGFRKSGGSSPQTLKLMFYLDFKRCIAGCTEKYVRHSDVKIFIDYPE
jgi:hypothetical protein